MGSVLGSLIKITLFGESHGPAIGATIDGLPPGIKINQAFINKKLNQRKPINNISTERKEADNVRFLSGIFNEYTTGSPLTFLIENNDVDSRDYEDIKNIARPLHADYRSFLKYRNFSDRRGGGHFSGRITAALVVCGAIITDALNKKGIYIGTHLKKCKEIEDRDFNEYENDIKILNELNFPVLDEEKAKEMMEMIQQAKSNSDSVGGILETIIVGVPNGIGEPWFDSIESLISHAVFSIPGVKGIEFGDGFDFVNLNGSEANDEFMISNDQIITKTNHNGGINGGISNGMPIIFRAVVKPTPSIGKKQNTVDFIRRQNVEIEVKGRHDAIIANRARPVIDAVVAIVIFELLLVKYGKDSW